MWADLQHAARAVSPARRGDKVAWTAGCVGKAPFEHQTPTRREACHSLVQSVLTRFPGIGHGSLRTAEQRPRLIEMMGDSRSTCRPALAKRVALSGGTKLGRAAQYYRTGNGRNRTYAENVVDLQRRDFGADVGMRRRLGEPAEILQLRLANQHLAGQRST